MCSSRFFPLWRSSTVLGFALMTSLTVQAARYVTDLVKVEPPAAHVETVVAAPHSGWVWQPGYYTWTHGQHVWMQGQWAEPPHPGYHWIPHIWVREGRGWRLREGYWVR